MNVELLKNKSISASDNRFKGRNVIQNGRKGIPRYEKLRMLLRSENVRRWVNYMKGNKEEIMRGIEERDEE